MTWKLSLWPPEPHTGWPLDSTKQKLVRVASSARRRIATSSTMNVDKETTLSKLGGEPALAAAAKIFYARLVADKSLQKFFVGRNISRLKQHQLNFMRFAFTNTPDGLDVPALLLEKHQHLFKMGMDEHISILWPIICSYMCTLQGLKMDPDATGEALAVISPLRSVFAQGAADCKKSSARSGEMWVPLDKPR